MFKRCLSQNNSLNVNHVTNHSSFSLVNRLVADVTVNVGHKYVNIHSHQLLILSEINKYIGEDTKAAARQSLNCIKK